MSSDRNWLPIAEWSGRLILPQASQRRPDGSVFIEIENCPAAHARLRNKICRLAPDPKSAYARHTASEVTDVRFTDAARQSMARNNNHPIRLDGWRSVSVFESLAGSRELDDMRVSLQNVVVKKSGAETLLRVDLEPVQIEGVEKALVRFVKALNADETMWTVAHWNPATRDFDGAEEALFYQPTPLPGVRKVPHTTLSRITDCAINKQGFYVYAAPTAQGRQLLAIEPRALIRLQAPWPQIAPDAVADYIDEDNWKSSRYGSWWHKELQPAGSGFPQWTPNSTGVLLHLFGWRGGPKGDRPHKSGLVTGHFATGGFRVVTDPFSGDPILDITYAQIYSHNPESIVAGFISHHAYTGSLIRGWQWVTPISDMLILHPALEDQFGSEGKRLVSPLSELSLSFARMIAYTRIGGGTGIVPVNMDMSCSQNSSLALLEALLAMRHKLASEPSSNAAANTLLALCQAVENVITPRSFGNVQIIPPRWRKWLAGKHLSTAKAGGLPSQIVGALIASGSVLPRELHDRLSLALHQYGASLLSLRSNQIGGIIDGIEPQWPTTYKRRHPMKLWSRKTV